MDTAARPISLVELARALAGAAPPLVLDVRHDARYAEAPNVIAGAQRCAPQDIAAFGAAGPPGDVVVYCVHGHEVSQTAARTLMAAGWPASFLEGGITAWQQAGLPLGPKPPGVVAEAGVWP